MRRLDFTLAPVYPTLCLSNCDDWLSLPGLREAPNDPRFSRREASAASEAVG
jgi:hypothetical protein